MLAEHEARICTFLAERFGCHTVLLYGSRAKGTARQTSDWDVVAITDIGMRERYFHGQLEHVGELNAYIYPESQLPFDRNFPSALYAPLNVFVTRLHYARVLQQKARIGDDLVAHAKALMESGAGEPSAAFKRHIHHYLFETRLTPYLTPEAPLPAGQDEVLRDFMRHEALNNCFYDYFNLRGLWAPTPAEAMAYLETHDLQAFDAFERANAPGATTHDFESLFHLVTVKA